MSQSDPDSVSPIWPGLEPYGETDSHRFFGRSVEVHDLLQRVERRTTTVLFAPSGAGKTSLLRAGLFPALRKKSLLPIYIRLDHSALAPTLVEQVWQRLEAHNLVHNEEGSPARAPTLWEWFHDSEEGLLAPRTSGVIPVLVFDQFEEIYTIGASLPERRELRDAFLEELADLVENRTPVDFQNRLEADDFQIDRYDFEEGRYRVVLALREDYVSLLDREKERMPSVMQNRMLLDRLKGAAALTVVEGPAPEIVPEGVGEKIVRYVAAEAGAPLEDVVVEPALLSLVCRQLDLAREGGRITEDLLSGHRDQILENFYEEAFEGLPARAREVVEEELVTESGHRQSLVAEDVGRHIGEEHLGTLIARRLLHIEQREKTPKVELTHDVLVPVVLRARALRRQREAAKEESKRREEAAREHLEKEKVRRHRLRWALVVSCLVASVALAGLFASLHFANQARLENVRKEEAYHALAESTATLRERTEELETALENLMVAQEAAQAEARRAETAREEAEQNAMEAQHAREEADQMLATALEWTEGLVNRAASAEGGLGPRSRINMLRNARELYEDLEQLDSAGHIDPREWRFQITLLEAEIYQQDLNYEQALRILEKVEVDLSWMEPEATRLYAAPVAELRGDIHYDQGRSIQRLLSDLPNGSAAQQQAAEEAFAKFRESQQAYQTALALASEDLLAQVRLHHKIGNAERNLRLWQEAEASLQDGVELLEAYRNTDDFDETLYQVWLADYYNKLGNLQHDQQRWGRGRAFLERANESYAKAVELRRDLSEAKPEDARRKYELALSLANLSSVRRRMDNESERRDPALYRERVNFSSELFQENPENAFYRSFHVTGLQNLAEIHRDANNNELWLRYAREAVELDRFENPRYLRTYREALEANGRRADAAAVGKLIEWQEGRQEPEPLATE